MPSEGCLEHNFALQTFIQDSKRSKKDLVVAWLDLSNAFGSVPFEVVFNALEAKGLHPFFIGLIQQMYMGSTTQLALSTGLSDVKFILKGVKQGCPLSPLIFNLAVDDLVRRVSTLAMDFGYSAYDTVPFDNGPRAMEEARQQKRLKYGDIELELTAKGYKVINEAFVVSSLGSFPARNFMVARELGIHKKYAELMAKLMVSETIRWSRDIYYTHVLGEPQERPRALEQSNPHVTPEAVKEAAEAEEEEVPGEDEDFDF